MSLPAPPAGKIILTHEDYLCLPDDGKRYEILEGVLYVTPSPATRHQRVSRNLQRLLDSFVFKNKLGEVFYAPLDVVLSNISITQPDLIYISSSNLEIITEKNIWGAPDLVVEILSPATSRTDKTIKAQVYAHHGVRYYWIVDSDSLTIEEYSLKGKSYVLVKKVQGNNVFIPELFPDLLIDLGQVWG